MTDPLEYIANHRSGILAGVLSLIAATAVLNWVLWMFGWGRFAGRPSPSSSGKPQTIRYVLAEFFVQIVNDFRHFLALILVALFATMLLVVTLPSALKTNGPDLEAMKDGFQSVAAAL